MGQCVSSKSKKGALASTQANAPARLRSRLLGNKMEKKNKVYRGTATSFGFKKPVTPSNALKSEANTNNSAANQQQLLTNSVESIVIAPTARSGTPRLARPKKDTNGLNARTNRFGFRAPSTLSNKVADSQNSLSSTKDSSDEAPSSKTVQVSLLPQPRSHLPRPQQFPVRLAAPAHYRPHARTASADKSAKTAANNHTARRSRSETGGSSASSVNDADSGVSSQKSGGELEKIEQLECSPSARSRLRNAQKSRPMEMVFRSGNEKKFELREIRDTIEVTEILPLELPPLTLTKRGCGMVRERAKAYVRQLSKDNNSNSSEDDEGIEDGPGEEKLHRDRVLSEKDEIGVVGAGEEAAVAEDLWGHGEAMAGEEDLSSGHDIDSDQGKAMAPPLRSVLLSIEDHSFAALAAMSTSTMLEDESYPELPDFQNSLSLTCTSNVTSPKDSQAPQPEKKNNSDSSPGTPGTPTHTSNSLSLSSDLRDRDFIDDEICDQPGLVYNNVTGNSSGNTIVADEPTPSPKVNKQLSAVANLTIDCGSGRHSSVGTLSPCESITSDDLIMDFDLSAIDDDHRLDASSIDLALTDAEGEGDEDNAKSIQELTALIAAHTELANGVRATRQLRPRVGSTGSDSPRSLDTPRLRSGSALSSPLRLSRQGTHSPGELSEDSGIRLDRDTYESMYQEVINMKAQLLRLRRVMQESEADQSQRMVFLQTQLEEKDRTIRSQQMMIQSQLKTIQSLQVSQGPEMRIQAETCNAATQTERIRPLSTGPILSTQPDSVGGSFVSNSSEFCRQQPSPNTRPASRLPQWRRTPSPSPLELHKPVPIGRKQT